MLREIRIANLALIDSLEINLENGLTVLTGETGAGKSIILQAIHLLAGGRAAAGWVRSGTEGARVEALFELSPAQEFLRGQLAAMGIEVDEELVIKRLISAKGKSRFYINGSLSTGGAVGGLMENLLSVASQHDHQQLLASRQHLEFIDAVGGLLGQRRDFSRCHERWLALRAEFARLRQQEQDKEQRRDFLLFQCQEIEEAAVVQGEDEALAVERDRLKAADQLMSLGHASQELLQEVVESSLARVHRNLEQMAGFDQSLAPLASRLADLRFQLEDALFELRDYAAHVSSDPARLDEVAGRIDLLQRLKRKYGPSLEEVAAFGERARAELAELEAMDARLAESRRQLDDCARELEKKAADLSASRRRIAAGLEKKVSRELASLSFDQAVFRIDFKQDGRDLERLGPLGWDHPQFLFSANPGEPAKPLARIASGGELSRLLLALKCVLAKRDQVETVIFDEVDAGISGKAAEAVARKIRELAGHHQVLCITHLPQIAATADDHFLVEKRIAAGRTQTIISRLPRQERVKALARMLDGDSVSDQTLAYARELIDRNESTP